MKTLIFLILATGTAQAQTDWNQMMAPLQGWYQQGNAQQDQANTNRLLQLQYERNNPRCRQYEVKDQYGYVIGYNEVCERR